MTIRNHDVEWPVHALTAVQGFHALKDKRNQAGALTLEETRHLHEVREIFEPERVTHRGFRRQPVRLPVRWTAVVLGPQEERQEGELVRLSLRRLEVCLEHPLQIGTRVRLIIAGPGPDEWVRFTGRITGMNARSNHAIVLIESAASWKTAHDGRQARS